MRQLLLIVLFSIAPFMIPRAHAEGFGQLTVQEAKMRLAQKNAFVFDNNDFDMFKKAHVPSAKWLDPMSYDAKSLPADKNATLIFYCHDEH